MIFTRTHIHDVFTIEPKVHGDSRGYFLETFRHDLFEKFTEKKITFLQDNESKSSFGVLRGLHFQLPPYAQSKLVRVIEGEVLDVALDLRPGSQTFGQHVKIKLSGDNKKQVFIPQGFAHGFLVLSPTCTFAYKVDNYYHQESDRGILYNDPELSIDWGIEESLIQISEKDRNLPAFNSIKIFLNQGTKE